MEPVFSFRGRSSADARPGPAGRDHGGRRRHGPFTRLMTGRAMERRGEAGVGYSGRGRVKRLGAPGGKDGSALRPGPFRGLPDVSVAPGEWGGRAKFGKRAGGIRLPPRDGVRYLRCGRAGATVAVKGRLRNTFAGCFERCTHFLFTAFGSGPETVTKPSGTRQGGGYLTFPRYPAAPGACPFIGPA